MNFIKKLFGNKPSSTKEDKTAAANGKPQGLIRHALLVASLPDKPTDPQMYSFLFDLLPELKNQPDDIATFGFLWETKSMDQIDMQELATSAFGSGILNTSKYIYRTLHIKLKTGEAKCFVVYDVDNK